MTYAGQICQTPVRQIWYTYEKYDKGMTNMKYVWQIWHTYDKYDIYKWQIVIQA